MRLRPDQIAQNLSKGMLPIYIVSGDESLLVQESCDAIRLNCRKQGFVREVLHVDNKFDWNELLASAAAMSLFADKKLIELRMPTGKPGTEGSKALVAYAANHSSDNILLISCNKIESSSTRSKWYKAVEDAGASIQCWPIDAKQLPRWIGQRLQQAGLRADNDALTMLAERVEGNLLAAVQEIEKLRLFTDADTIDVDTVSAAVADNARYDVFGLVDRALEGDSSASIRILRGLKAEGTEPPVVLWALSRELRTLFHCAEQIEQGNGVDRVLQNQRVWDKRKAIIKQALGRLRKSQLQQMLKTANEVDRAVKGMSKENSWDLLEQLVAALAGKPVVLQI
ncbi:MAG: DNA polymerase-3 subunit delta [Oceanicoccus sp.]|jgi:DNA polymerase-3 subunit delta